MNIDFDKKPYTNNHILSGSSFWNFFRILADNNFNIEGRYIPKLLKSFFIILISQPNILLEKFLYHSKIKK
ncbi:hypothetical protein, partial [Bradyrhizobium sp. NBAIM08]|uniref:hypothetical protein n=1 Tax=Bradyrhizobium sp. NBAIM08 TaxID=2793815 RepID=UPI001CD3AA47